MNHTECRTLILQRLQARDKQSAQFDRIIRSYQYLADSMRHLMTRQKFSSRSVRKSQSSLPQESSLEHEEQIAALESKYEEICLQKGVNDQQLIETTNRLLNVEKELKNTQIERDRALETIEKLKKDLTRTKEEMEQLKSDNRTLFDEHIALQAAYSAVEAKYSQADKERAELINRMKELKEREITLVNEMNEREQQLNLQKLQCDLAEASKPNPVLDAKAFCSVLNIHDSFEVLAADEKGVADVSDSAFAQERLEFTGAVQGLTRIDIHIESGHLLGSSNDCAVRLWSIDDQRMRVAFTGHTDKVTSAKFMSDGRQVASGSNDRTIKIWDTITNRCQKTFFPGSTICDLVTNDHYGAPLISAHFDKKIRFWDTRAPGDSPTNLVKFDAKMTSLCLTSDFMYLLCSSRDETLTLLDLRTNDALHIYSAEQYRTSSDYSRAAVISPGDSYVAAGSADGHIFIWSLHSTRLEKILFRGGHENIPVLSLAWHPAGHVLISGDKRKTVCLWK
uniref:Autophagy-related protein 16 domain-containing protein n=1 Tax=Meloidogyne javanica TaxID=6303 RepID=A0A915MW81_MELJA